MGKQVKLVQSEESTWTPPADAIAIDEQQQPQAASTTWTPPADAIPVAEEPVKKKDEEKSVTNLLPSSGLDEHGQPSGIPTVANSKKLKSMQKPSLQEKQSADLREMAKQKPMTEQDARLQSDLRNRNVHDLEELVLGPDKERIPLVTGAKSLWNVLSNQLPAAGASAVALLTPDKPVSPGGGFVPPSSPETVKGIQEVKKSLLNWAAERQQKGTKFTEDLISKLDEIRDPLDAVNYVFNALGQATGQIPTTVLSGGTTAFMQGVGDTYLSGIQRVAKEKGLTIDEVMDKGLDEPGIALAFGTVIAALDKVGAGKVMGSFTKQAFKQSLRARAVNVAVSGAIEAQTEYMQTGLQQMSDEISTGKTVGEAAREVYTNPEKKTERKEAYVQGGIGGGLLSGTGHASPEITIRQQTQAADVSNEASLDLAAKEIQASVDQAATPVPVVKAPVEQPVAEPTEIPQPQNTEQNASTVREDQGSVPQGGEIPEGSQDNSGGDLQQATPGEPVNGETVQQAQDEGADSVAPEIVPAETAPVTEEVKTQRLKIADRILNSDANEAIKAGIREQGPDYVPKKINVTDKEAKDLIEHHGPDKIESFIRDTKNDITGDTRTALAAKLYEKYKSDGDRATNPEEKQTLYNKAVDIALVGAEQAKEAGRAVNANKIWKLITGDEDSLVLAMEKENRGSVSKFVAPVQKKLAESKLQFDQEMRKVIAQKVTEGVETQLARAKLITKEKRQEIASFFDSKKVSTKGTANDITRVVGAQIWNGAMEVTKRTILAGADVANAVQAGIDYITTHYKGADFKPEEYAAMMTPQITPLVPTKPVAAESIEEKVKVPGLSGKKKKDFITSVVEEYNKKGTISDDKFEQLYAKQVGYKELTDDERGKIRELAKIITEAEKFKEVVQADFTDINQAKYKELLRLAQKANQKMQEFARQPPNLADTLIAMMQGNLLTTGSLVTNIYSNLALQPLRALSTANASVVDQVISKVAKLANLDRNYKSTSIDIGALLKAIPKGGWDGISEGAYQLKHGQLPDERDLREVSSGFSPLRAVKRWGDKDRTKAQKINDAIEGTLGWHAEGMFRLLNMGDKPFRRVAELGKAMELANKRGLKGDDAKKFIMFPDEASADLIKKAGDDATFQQETELSKKVQGGINWAINKLGSVPYIGDFLKVVGKAQVPYVKTPLNIVIETMSYAVPEVTAAVGLYKLYQGDKEAAVKLIGKAMTGFLIKNVAKTLFGMGLMSADDDKDKKARNIQFDNVPPNSVNVSAVARIMAFEDGTTQDDDAWVNYEKLGVLGILFRNYSRLFYAKTKENEEDDYFRDAVMTGFNTVGSAVDYSFLKGTSNLLNAIQSGGGYEANTWAIETLGAVSSIVYPNTLASLSKSSDEYIRDTYNRNFGERLKATFQAKMFMGDKLPPKVNLWGEKVRGNPEGRNKYVYYLFDPTKFRNVDTDSYKYKLYEAWKTDNFNNKWLPSLPDRSENVKGVNMKLSPQEYEKLATYVGEERARAVQAYVNSSWRYHSNEKRLDRLHDIYSEAAARGKKKFLMDTGWNVLNKKKLEELNKNR